MKKIFSFFRSVKKKNEKKSREINPISGIEVVNNQINI